MKIIALLMLLTSANPIFFAGKTADFHSLTVAQVLIDNYHNDLYAEVYLKKSMFTMALRKEAHCNPQEMISKCGNEYFQKHLRLKLNDRAMIFENQSIDIQKDFIIYRYFLGSAEEGIKKIEVESDYMLQYDDHSITKVRIKIDDLEKQYSLRNSLRKITFSLDK